MNFSPADQEESQSTPALLTAGGAAVGHSAISLGIIPEHSLLESCARLSVSLEGPGIFSNQSTCSSSGSTRTESEQKQLQRDNHMTMEELRAVNRYAESTKSLSFLPQVSSSAVALVASDTAATLHSCRDCGGRRASILCRTNQDSVRQTV